jgi:LPXTG-motif cell wall-anchored protein
VPHPPAPKPRLPETGGFGGPSFLLAGLMAVALAGGGYLLGARRQRGSDAIWRRGGGDAVWRQPISLRHKLIAFALCGLMLVGTIAFYPALAGGAAPAIQGQSQDGGDAGHDHEAARFAAIYPVTAGHPFVFASFQEVADLLASGTGILAFGFPECPRCQSAFPVLERAFREAAMYSPWVSAGQILYYDILDDSPAVICQVPEEK